MYIFLIYTYPQYRLVWEWNLETWLFHVTKNVKFIYLMTDRLGGRPTNFTWELKKPGPSWCLLSTVHSVHESILHIVYHNIIIHVQFIFLDIIFIALDIIFIVVFIILTHYILAAKVFIYKISTNFQHFNFSLENCNASISVDCFKQQILMLRNEKMVII